MTGFGPRGSVMVRAGYAVGLMLACVWVGVGVDCSQGDLDVRNLGAGTGSVLHPSVLVVVTIDGALQMFWCCVTYHMISQGSATAVDPDTGSALWESSSEWGSLLAPSSTGHENGQSEEPVVRSCRASIVSGALMQISGHSRVRAGGCLVCSAEG